MELAGFGIGEGPQLDLDRESLEQRSVLPVDLLQHPGDRRTAYDQEYVLFLQPAIDVSLQRRGDLIQLFDRVRQFVQEHDELLLRLQRLKEFRQVREFLNILADPVSRLALELCDAVGDLSEDPFRTVAL